MEKRTLKMGEYTLFYKSPRLDWHVYITTYKIDDEWQVTVEREERSARW